MKIKHDLDFFYKKCSKCVEELQNDTSNWSVYIFLANTTTYNLVWPGDQHVIASSRMSQLQIFIPTKIKNYSFTSSHWLVGRRHAGTPHRQGVHPNTVGGTVFARSNKLKHHFRVFYNFRHQTVRTWQVKAPLMYLTLYITSTNIYLLVLVCYL